MQKKQKELKEREEAVLQQLDAEKMDKTTLVEELKQLKYHRNKTGDRYQEREGCSPRFSCFRIWDEGEALWRGIGEFVKDP